MRRRKLVLVAHLIGATLLVASIGLYSWIVSTDDGDGTHEPIHIVADDYFNAENGVSSGTGTESDPFVISDMVIEVSSDPELEEQGIRISHTTAHFVVRNVTIYSDGHMTGPSERYPVGIFLNSAENATVESCTILGLSIGIELAISPGATIIGNTITGCGVGVHSSLSASIGYQHGLSIADNEFVNNTVGIHIDYSPWDIEVNGNSFMDSCEPVLIEGCRGIVFQDNLIGVTGAGGYTSSEGPVFRACHDLDVRRNSVSWVSDDGLVIDSSTGVQVIDNAISCGGIGLQVSGSTEVNVTGCEISSDEVGVWIQSCDLIYVTMNRLSKSVISFVTVSPDEVSGPVVVFRNHVEVATVALVDDGAMAVSWNAAYPEGGNFWEGEIGSYVPYDSDGDGISDAPLYLDGDSFDAYPLMASPL